MSSVQPQQLPGGCLERMAARRTYPLHARTAVCRSLFGPIDHDELRRETKSKLREISERDRRRWNFNFATDTPLQGGEYEWEEGGDDVPAFYRESVHRSKPRLQCPVPESCHSGTDGSDPAAALDGNADSAGLAHRLLGLEGNETNQENRTDNLHSGIKAGRAPCLRKRNSTARITDFFAKRKKTVGSKASSENASLSGVPGEQTPRKRIR
ncbi:cyclin-dependent kinase inhibitor 1C [Rhincodon typus]|uniref:cyclin-dependent kinase inhibitor 1C n=1 Tax=Rhincodon typus TaxID=259920 RepID=UPI0009A37011|nr:cyclin-dependent kinase inhibitor 1C [Rhincodon typus]